VWLRQEDFKKLNQYEALYGKLLILCQKYEKTCKEIVKWLNLAVSIDQKEFDFLSDEHMSYAEKLDKLFLAGSINALDKNLKLDVSEQDINLLHRGRESRNWIIHSSADLVFNKVYSSRDLWINAELHNLISGHLKNIIRADFVVSTWSFEFHEKELSSFNDIDKYTEMISNWVLSDFNEEEDIR